MKVLELNLENMQMIGQGNTAQIYLMEKNKVLKLFRKEIPAEVAEREYKNGVSVNNVLKNTPKVYEKVECNGRYGIVYEKVNGKDYIQLMLKSLWKINYYAKKFAEYHKKIHLKSDLRLEPVKDKLKKDISAADMLDEQQKHQITEYLLKLPDGDDICHFDFHPGNIMSGDDKEYILDWMTACIGNSCADAARTWILLNYGVDCHASLLAKKVISMFQRYIAIVYMKEYIKLTGCSKEDIHKWILPVAAGRLREWIPDEEKKKLLQIVNLEIKRLSALC